MRIVTRPDFDGIVCAVLLYEALDIKEPVVWVEPNHVQKGLVNIQNEDIIANLPYNAGCALWFDHHFTNQIDTPFKGAFQIAPSAAGIIFQYYQSSFQRDYSEGVRIVFRKLSSNQKIFTPDLLASITIALKDIYHIYGIKFRPAQNDDLLWALSAPIDIGGSQMHIRHRLCSHV